jgi:hypothetical protein
MRSGPDSRPRSVPPILHASFLPISFGALVYYGFHRCKEREKKSGGFSLYAVSPLFFSDLVTLTKRNYWSNYFLT